MKKKIKNIYTIIVIIIILLIANIAGATSFCTDEKKCPVCLNKIKVKTLLATNSFGGHDRDFFQYAVGNQPLIIIPCVCPVCLYSGYSSDFETIETNLISKLKESILERKLLKIPQTDFYVPSSNEIIIETMPAFIKYDLIAQCYKIIGKDTSEVFGQYLSAAWAVRLERELYFDLKSPQAANAMNWIQKNIDMTSIDTVENNNAASELNLGRCLLKRAPLLAGDDLLNCSLGALFFLRSHGENAEAEKALGYLKKVMKPEIYESLEKKVTASIECEKKYLSLALYALESDMNAGKINGDVQIARMHYLAGELCRRCLKIEKARQYFKKALNSGRLTAPFDSYASQQLELCK